MRHHFLLWASGEDKSGIVSAVTKALFDHGMNLEDSSMMRLGSEFGIFLIFTARSSEAAVRLEESLVSVRRGLKLSIGMKKISARQAAFKKKPGQPYLVSVHGPDRPGIVARVTGVLAKRGFNITDLSTHRTTSGAKPGYVLFIEGEVKRAASVRLIRADLERLQRLLKSKVELRAVPSESF